MSEAALDRGPSTEAAPAPTSPPLGPLAFTGLDLPSALNAPGARISALASFGTGLVIGTEATSATGTGGSILRLDLARGEADEVVSLPPPSAADLAAWREAVASPLALGVPARPGILDPETAPVGRVTGFATFQGAADDCPCLYATTASLRGGDLLRSESGLGYMRVWSQRRRTAGLAGLSAPVAWQRHLALWSWAEGEEDDLRLLPQGAVLASPSPAQGEWEALSPPGFGDPANQGLAAMTVAFGRLHVATANPVRGFQVWSAARRRGERRPDPWARSLDLGAHRFAMSGAAASVAAFGSALYIGTATLDDGLAGAAPPAPELLRIEHDGGWELVAGETRLTPQGLKVPLSLLGPGLGDPTARRILVAAGARHVAAVTPGGRMILSQDGEDWEEVPGLARALRPGETVGALLIDGPDLLVAAGARLLRAGLPS